MPVIGLVISNAYEQHMEASVKNELKAYSYTILAVAEMSGNTLVMPDALIENQFNISGSGLYAFFTSATDHQQVIWRSASLLAMELPNTIHLPVSGNSQFYFADLEHSPHFLYSFSVEFQHEDITYPVTLHVAKEQVTQQLLMQEFQRKLWLALIVFIVILISLQFVWLLWSLKPLSSLTQELADIEQGKATALIKTYPKELQQVTTQLNHLLIAEQQQRSRYRNALSDLAHSLKTPLAVIKSQNNLASDTIEQLDNINNMVEHQLKRAQSAADSAWHLGIEVKPCVEKLIASLDKIYRDKNIITQVTISETTIFKGDESDLFEILGNLLDNAYKAAEQVIIVSIYRDEQLHIFIEDDGVGIDEKQQTVIFNRGTRVDTYQEGHGIGLAIVRDLVASYQGHIVISSSKTLGGAHFHLTFK